ncbi:MAG TPA: hypothetical protein PKD99_02200 [Sphingopyxis sp.]|nr:hypothetical protein [Sphingopyxis sp.]HMP43888.1 hypothetical protein [Sphingopyxis sp.]HMQ18511.1 hypothetical protein [Sphingopyxis sp.]
MATIGLELRAGIARAPWRGLLVHVGAMLVLAGLNEDRVIRLILPLCGLGWTRLGSGRRRYFLLRSD